MRKLSLMRRIPLRPKKEKTPGTQPISVRIEVGMFEDCRKLKAIYGFEVGEFVREFLNEELPKVKKYLEEKAG